MTKRSVCVFCGARDGDSPRFLEDATLVGQMLADHGWRLVYGAGDIGLMGAVARAAQDSDAATLGVIPEHLMRTERLHASSGSMIVTQTMHERKKVMFMNSDAIVVLPGGAGSLDEFFEVLTWRQLGLHKKPILLLNTAGYWTPLAQMIEHVIARGFADETLRDYVHVVEDVTSLAAALRAALS